MLPDAAAGIRASRITEEERNKQQAQKVSILSIIIGFIFLIYGERCLATLALPTSAISPSKAQMSSNRMEPSPTQPPADLHGLGESSKSALLISPSPALPFFSPVANTSRGGTRLRAAAGWSRGRTTTASSLGHLHAGKPSHEAELPLELTNKLQPASVLSNTLILC